MTFKYIQNFFFFGFLAIATILFFYLIGNFIFTIFWAIVSAIIFYPLYKWFLKKTKNRENLSSLLSTIFVLIIVIFPIASITTIFTKEVVEITKNVSSTSILESIDNLSNNNFIYSTLNNFGISLEEVKKTAVNSFEKILTKLGEISLEFGKNTLQVIINFFIMIYLLFFFFRDGKKMLIKISDIIPLGNNIEKNIFTRFITIVKSIFKGTIIIALIQGTIGGLLFFAVGIEAAFLWGIIMLILSIIPAVGPVIIILPTSLFFLFTGETWQGLILLLGTIIVSTVDNVLRPILVEGDTQIPNIIIMLSIFGGLVLYGISGLIIGPIIAGIFITMWSIFEEKYKKELKNN